jgi:uncharacterized protein YggE
MCNSINSATFNLHPAFIIPQFGETDQATQFYQAQKDNYSMTTHNLSFRKYAIIAALSLFGFGALSIPAAFAEPTISKISVSGTGSATSTPDMAMITLGVQSQAKTARKALSENNTAMAKVLAALKGEDIADKDLQTSNFHIRPQYQHFKRTSENKNKPPKIVGYIVGNQLSVRIRDLSKLGKIIDLTITLGVNSGGNIRFMSENPGPIITQARQKAVENAIEKAKVLASAAGVGLGKIISISESNHRPRPVAMQNMAMARAPSAKSVPIAAGENSYSVTVQVSWELKQ